MYMYEKTSILLNIATEFKLFWNCQNKSLFHPLLAIIFFSLNRYARGKFVLLCALLNSHFPLSNIFPSTLSNQKLFATFLLFLIGWMCLHFTVSSDQVIVLRVIGRVLVLHLPLSICYKNEVNENIWRPSRKCAELVYICTLEIPKCSTTC
jgi:hypothetical protein